MAFPDPQKQETDPRIRLVVGMSRAGTTGMVEALNSHPDVCAFGETKFYGVSAAKNATLDAGAIADLNRHFKSIVLRLRSPDTAEPRETDALKSAILDALNALPIPISRAGAFVSIGEAAAQALGKTYWVEKTPHHLMHLAEVLQDDHCARVVVMLRAPEGFLLSYKHQGDRKRRAVRKTLHNLYHPLIVSLICRRYLRAARKWQDRSPEVVLVVGLEDVKTSPEDTYGTVLDHLCLPAAEIASDTRSNSSFNSNAPRPELAQVERFWLGLLTNGDAVAFGFRPIAYRFQPLAVLVSLATLLVWPLRNASVLFKLRRVLGVMFSRWVK